MVQRQLYLYEYIDAPFDDVAQVLASEGGDLFSDATAAAVERADKVRAELVVDLGAFEIGREVEIEVGEFDPVEVMRVKVPLRWKAAEAAALFPSLTADLEVAALAFHPPLTQVTIVGHYDPPLGVLGAAGDALFGHRVAEAALHRFMHTVVARLTEEAAKIEHPEISRS
jgi:hypothetical protein